MSENWKFQVSPKIGDMLSNVRGDTAEEFEANLANFPFAAVAQFQANLAGAGALGQIVQPQQQEPTQPIVHPSGQTNVVPFQQPQQQAQPPAWAQPAQQGGGEVCDNSDGKSPAACGLALQPKQTRTGKNQLVCPQYRYSQGQGGNGHRVVWL